LKRTVLLHDIKRSICNMELTVTGMYFENVTTVFIQKNQIGSSSSINTLLINNCTDYVLSEESNADAEVAEPEEKQLTLDEWKALQDRNRTKAAFNIRKAGEGVSAAPEWKKMFVLKKKVPDEHDEEEEEEEEEVRLC
jgi:Hyaluronan / mRNA binding family